LNVRFVRRASIGSLLMAAALISLTGCQLLGKSQTQINDTIVLGSTSLDFGKVGLGNSKAMPNTLTNFKTSSVTIVSIAGQDSNFQIIGITLPLVLTPGQVAQFSVQFQPGTLGQQSATISFGDNSQFLASLTVSGNAVQPGQLLLNPSLLSFGNVKVGSNKTGSVTFSNNGGTDINITQVTLSGAGFSIGNLALPLTLHAGGSASLSTTFAPTGPGNFTGSVSFSAYSGPKLTNFRSKTQAPPPNNSWVLTLDGTGQADGTLAANPATLAFGNVQVGSSSSKSETLTNTGGTTITISQADVTGTGFSISGLTLPAALAANQSVAFAVKFTPATAGAVSGNLAIVSDTSNSPLNIALSGTGTTPGQLSASPTSLSFGNVQIGSSSTKSETLTNSGGTAITISQANVTGAGYSVSGLTLPATLAAGQSVGFTVTFSPTTGGAANGTLAIVSDAPGSPLNIGLTGTGVTQGQLTPNPTTLSFGNVLLGSSKTLSETLTNSGGSSVTISAASASGTGFSLSGLALPLTLNAGQSTSFSVQFAPAATGGVSGSIRITSDGANPNLNIALSGSGTTPGALSANPTTLAFGSVQVGSNSSLSETLTNTGGANVTISQATVTGTGFSVVGLALPATLTPNQSVAFTVKFAPTAGGNITGNLAIVSDAPGSPLNIALSGTGVTPGSLIANPSTVNFGNVTVGSNKAVPVTVTNSGGSAVTISLASATGNGFSFNGPNLPVTVGAGQSATFNAVFTPTAAGSSSGNLTITSDANNPTLTIPLSGVGVAQGQITPNPTSLSFGNVTVGSSVSLTENLTNSGGTSLTISAASATGSGFSISGLTLPLTLTAGQSTSFTVRFAPTTGGAVTGNVAISSDGANPNLNIALSGTGVTAGTLSANPTSLSFGNVQVGSSLNLSETLTNTGGSAVNISQANVTGTGYSITGLTLPTTLTPGQSVTFTATFAPTAGGAVSGNLAIISDASNATLNIALSGTGLAPGQLAVTPATLAFGNVVVNTSLSLNGTLTASGASVIVSSGSSDSSEFVLSGITLPKTIAAGQSASFTVTFTPNASGSASARLTFQSNASNSPTVESLTGNGQAPQPHSVDLTWNASQSPGVVGYNVYRRTPTGSYGSAINGSLNAGTAYTDTTVTAGQTYFYVAKAVDGNGLESGPSNEVQAVIPTP
jgi:hypothetical protein